MSVTSYQTPERELLSSRPEHRRPPQNPFPLDREFVPQRFHRLAFRQSLLHHPGHDYRRWRDDALQTLRHCLVMPDTLGEPSHPVLLHRDDSHPGYTVEELEISVTPPLRAPATVVIPKNGRPRHPAVVALHSMGGFQLYGREKLLARANENPLLTRYRQKFYDGFSLQARLAEAGFLSIAIDSINFGLRTTEALSRGPEFEAWRTTTDEAALMDFQQSLRGQTEPLLARTLLALGYSTAALVASDDLRTVDYLLTRPDVEPRRIACMGLSLGAFRTHYLAALDARITAAVSVCWLSTLAGIIPRNISGALGFFALPPGFYRHFDLVDIPALIAPRPFLAISGWEDVMIHPDGMANAHRFLRDVWQRAGAPEQLGSLLYDAPHCFNAGMQTAALGFLKRFL